MVPCIQYCNIVLRKIPLLFRIHFPPSVPSVPRKGTFRRLWSEPKRYNEPFESAEQLRPRTSTLALKCAGTIKAIFEGPRPPVASCNCRRDASWRPHDFSPLFPSGVFTTHPSHRVSEARGRARGIRCIFRHEAEKDHPRALISSSEGLWKKASGRWIRSPVPETKGVAGASPAVYVARERIDVQTPVLSTFPAKLKCLPYSRVYLWEARNASSLTFQSLRGDRMIHYSA